MTERGFIAIARGMLEHPIVGATKPYADSEAWLWLLFETAWRARRVRVTNGRAVGALSIERGQLSYSRSYLAAAWGWSEKRVRTFLNRLEADRMIALQTGQPQTVITICNYETYQNPDPSRGRQMDGQWAGNGPETEQGNKETKDNMRPLAGEPDGFAAWYAAYPRREDRRRAALAYKAALRRGDCTVESLFQAAQQYAAAKSETETRFIKLPASWLNASSYLNQEPAAKNESGLKIEPPSQRDPSTFTESEWRESGVLLPPFALRSVLRVFGSDFDR